MNNILKKLIYLPFFLLFTCITAFAQNYTIDYYGIVSEVLDNNMAKMTSDLYYTQLSELQTFTINDMRTTACRSTAPDISTITSDNPIFYSEIIKDNDEKLTVSFVLINPTNEEKFIKSKSYDTFYKILIESKNDLKKIVKDLVNGVSDTNTTQQIQGDTPQTSKELQKLDITSAEILSGTWVGEESIDKIVILRGGRGFVIFENGASMNITLKIETIDNEQIISIQQKSNPNASFYPELPRKIALDAAISAPPIKWSMKLFEGMIMSGTKTTLVQDNQSYKTGTFPVTWKKIN